MNQYQGQHQYRHAIGSYSSNDAMQCACKYRMSIGSHSFPMRGKHENRGLSVTTRRDCVPIAPAQDPEHVRCAPFLVRSEDLSRAGCPLGVGGTAMSKG